MPLHHTRDGYNFNADAQTLSIGPGPKPVTLTRWELERLGLIFQDVHPLRFDTETEKEGVIEAIMDSLTKALARCRGKKDAWMYRNVRRAILLIGGLNEVDVVKILGHEEFYVELTLIT